jgi:WD40 repeat protein
MQPRDLTLTEIIDTTLRMSKLGLIDIYQQAQLGEGVNLLVVVDQFEELFRYRQLRTGQQDAIYSASEEATAFVNLLLEAKQQNTYPIYIVLTMRSDFLGDCAQFPGLTEAINAGQYLVPRMTREERRAAISGPIGVSGAEISPVLLTRLINDVGDNPDQLSILQHALNRTWARWKFQGGGGMLDLPHYEAIGTMAHALDQHAEKAYAELDTERKQQLCEKIFKALTDKATDSRGVRRPTTLSTLCALTDATAAEITAVIDVFRTPSRSFLMPPIGEPLRAETVIDISHESLMRVWQRLMAWADAEAQSAQTYHRLAETSMLHKAGRARLWQDPDLQVALDWRAKEQPNETWAHRYYEGFMQAMAFLDASLAHRDEEMREQEARRQYALEQEKILTEQQRLTQAGQIRAKEQARTIRRFRWLTMMLALTFVGAVGAAAWAIQQTRLATLRSLEASALNHIKQLDLSMLLSVEALEIDDRSESESVLLNVLEQRTHPTTYLRGHAGSVRSVALSADGKILASGSADNTIILWNAITHQPLGLPLTGHTGSLWSVALSADGKILASGSGDNTVMLWDVTTRQPLGPPLIGHTGSVVSVALSGDGKILVSGSEDGTIILWDMVTRQPLGSPFIGHNGPVRSVVLSSDGTILASGSKDSTIIVWDVATRQPIGAPLIGHNGTVLSIALSADGKTLASGSGDNTIRLWDLTTHQPLGSPLAVHTSAVFSVALSGDGKTLASGSEDSTILLWDTTTRPPFGLPLTGYTSPVLSVALSANGRILASGSDDKTIHLRDAVTQQSLGPPITGHTGAVASVALSADGKLLASGSGDKTIRLWDVDTRQPLGLPLTGSTSAVLSVALSDDGKILASSSDDRTIRLWDVATFQPMGSPLINNGTVWSVSLSADGKILASGSSDKTIQLWDVATQKPLGPPLIGHTGVVRSVALSPDGKILASSSVDKTIRLWDVATRQPLGPPLTGHASAIRSVAMSADGLTLVSGSDDNTVRLWDVITHQPLGSPLIGHGDAILSVALSADGKILVSGGDDNTVRVWNINFRPLIRSHFDSWKERACRIANRNLTRAEWQQFMAREPYRATCPDLPLSNE